MIVVLRKNASESQREEVKQYLVELDCDFHQSTGNDRLILGVVGDTRTIDEEDLYALPGVHVVFRIPPEIDEL